MLPELLQDQLSALGVTHFDESALRTLLEEYVETYTLFKLAPWPARRWKCHYRLMMHEDVYDAQTISEAYALGVLAMLAKETASEP